MTENRRHGIRRPFLLLQGTGAMTGLAGEGGGDNCKNIGTMTLFLFGNFLWEKHPTSNYLESC